MGIYFSSLYFKFDPYYFIFGDLVGDSTYQQTTSFEFIVCLVLRALLTLCAFECARSNTYLIMVLLLVINSLQLQIQDMLNYGRFSYLGLRRILFKFRYLSFVYVNIRASLQEYMTLGICALFWGTVIGFWLLIRAHKSFSPLLYLMSLITALMAFLTICIWLTLLLKYSNSTILLRSIMRNEANKVHAICKYGTMAKETLVMKKETLIELPIRMYLHPFILIDCGFCKATVKNLLERIFDAILIF